jgi:hypothetical protein
MTVGDTSPDCVPYARTGGLYAADVSLRVIDVASQGSRAVRPKARK